MSLGILLFSSCSKEETNDLTIETLAKSVYVFNQSTGTLDYEIMDRNNSLTNPIVTKGGNRTHAHGDFTLNGGTISFSGTQNNGGAHGGAEFNYTFGPFGTAHVILETVSVVSIGEGEAIYGGIITEVIENTVMFPPPPPPPPCPTFPNCPPPPPPSPCDAYELGTYVYFVVKDNGQGNNAPMDKYNNVLLNSCFAQTNGGADIPWFLFGNSDVGPNDKIKVND